MKPCCSWYLSVCDLPDVYADQTFLIAKLGGKGGTVYFIAGLVDVEPCDFPISSLPKILSLLCMHCF